MRTRARGRAPGVRGGTRLRQEQGPWGEGRDEGFSSSSRELLSRRPSDLPPTDRASSNDTRPFNHVYVYGGAAAHVSQYISKYLGSQCGNCVIVCSKA